MLAEGTTSGGKVLEPVHGAVRRGAPSTRHSLVRELIRKQLRGRYSSEGYSAHVHVAILVPQQCSARSEKFRVTPNPGRPGEKTHPTSRVHCHCTHSSLLQLGVSRESLLQ